MNLVRVAWLALGLALGANASADPLPIGGGVQIRVAPRSLKALRDLHVVRQAQDFSCGAAALATLLTFGLGERVTEREIIDDLLDQLSPEDTTGRQKNGFSLLDLQRVALRRGYKAQAFRIASRDLPRLNGPAIVFIEPQGYKHFAVLRGVQGDRVFLADPSRGNVRMPAHQFLPIWEGGDGTGIIFVVERISSGSAKPVLLDIGRVAASQPEILSARELLAVRAATAPVFQPHR